MKKTNKIKVFGNPYSLDTLLVKIYDNNGNCLHKDYYYPHEIDEIIARNRTAKVYYINDHCMEDENER